VALAADRCVKNLRNNDFDAILHRKPMLTDISVFLIGQSLGF
jgi:hypothetical protein